MIKLVWTNQYWAPVPLAISYSITQPKEPLGETKYTLTRSRSDTPDTTNLGDDFDSLADAQAAAQADCDKFFGTF